MANFEIFANILHNCEDLLASAPEVYDFEIKRIHGPILSVNIKLKKYLDFDKWIYIENYLKDIYKKSIIVGYKNCTIKVENIYENICLFKM